MVVALARKLLIALWRFVTDGVVRSLKACCLIGPAVRPALQTRSGPTI